MSTGRLLGRTDELAVVEATVGSAAALPAALVVSGEPGIGKTALWREGILLARERSCTVLSCTPVEAETHLSFAGLGDLLDGVLDAALGELPAPQCRALEIALRRADVEGQPPDQLAIGVALLSALRVLARGGPVLVAVDDVQWLDAPSASALAFVARRLRSEPVGLLLGLRREQGGVGTPLGLDRAPPEFRVVRLELEPLTLGAVHRLLHLKLGAVFPRPTLAALYETSAGNPLFALELGRALRGREIAPGPEQRLPVPSSLTGLVRERLGHLSPDTRRALLATAALSHPTFEVLESVIGSGQLASALDEAAGAGVVEFDQSGVRFVHPLLGSACYGEAMPRQRRELHRRLAEVVSDAEQRARHLALGTEAPDRAVAAVLERAASEAAKRGAPQAAAELLELAIDLTPREQRDSLRRRRVFAGDHHFSCGDVRRARARFEEAAADTPMGAERASVLVRIAETRRDDLEAAISLCGQALVEAAGDERQLARVHHLLAHLWANRGDSHRSLAHARSTLELAESTADSALLAAALTRAAAHEYRGGTSEIAPALLQRAIAIDPAGTSVPVYWGPRLTLARILVYQGRVEEARATFEGALNVATTNGDERSRLRVLSYVAELEWMTGKFARAAQHAAEAFELAEQVELDPEGSAALYQRAIVAVHLGRVEEARAAAQRILAQAEARKAHEGRIDGHAVLGFLELSLGNLDVADRYLRPLPALKLVQGWRAPTMTPVWENAIEAMIGVGELDEARTHLAQYEQLGREYESPWALATAARCEGLLYAAEGDVTRAFDAFERALGEHALAGSPFERARTLVCYGAVLRRAKRRREARAMLEEAHAKFERLSTPLWAERARTELARIGGRRPSGAELTATERRIAELVAEGRSNKEVAALMFVTPKTVETNLSRMYAKLGIHTRAELANRMLSGSKL